MYFGEVVKKSEKTLYTKVVIAVETGYHTRMFIIRTKKLKLTKPVYVGDRVIFSGSNIAGSFVLESLQKHAFRSCDKCGLNLSTRKCIIKHDKEAQKVEGIWQVLDIIASDNGIKAFFGVEDYVIAAVALNKCWYYSVFEDLIKGDMVRLKGWRYRNITTLSSIYREVTYEVMQKQQDYENLE